MARFRLQRILDYRQRREEQMRQRFGAAVSARVRAEQDLATLDAAVERERVSLGRLLAEARVDAGTLRDRNANLELYARAVEAQREAVARALAFENEERGHLTAAMADRKALDTLRDRHIEWERREDLRKDALVLDEIAGRRALRERLAATG